MSAKGREVDRFLQGKAYKASIQGISKKGTYNTNERRYNPLDWALLSPPATDADHEQAIKPLAETFAIIARKRGGLPEDEAVKAMLGIREDLYMNWPGQYLYFYMGPPRFRPLPVMLGVWHMMQERDEQLRLLAGYNTTDLIEPPILEDFSTEHLGTGVKVWCVQKAPRRRSKAVVGLLGYAFRNEELETDLHLKAMCPDLGWLQGAMPHIDEFVRAISIVPRQKKESDADN
jgi:hypothetical protein